MRQQLRYPACAPTLNQPEVWLQVPRAVFDATQALQSNPVKQGGADMYTVLQPVHLILGCMPHLSPEPERA